MLVIKALNSVCTWVSYAASMATASGLLLGFGIISPVVCGWPGSRVRRTAGERDLVATGAPLEVVPEIIHLHFVLRECGIVLLNQNFAKVERLPTHGNACRGRERADTHDRQIGVDATVEEIEIENVRHGSTQSD